jgi:hypothetical protein
LPKQHFKRPDAATRLGVLWHLMPRLGFGVLDHAEKVAM